MNLKGVYICTVKYGSQDTLFLSETSVLRSVSQYTNMTHHIIQLLSRNQMSVFGFPFQLCCGIIIKRKGFLFSALNGFVNISANL